MKIFLENISMQSSSGPNSFAKKLIPHLNKEENEFVNVDSADVSLCFIESPREIKCPRLLRLDGIYFNTSQDYTSLNRNIRRTYDNSAGIVFQSEFNRELITRYFGEHENTTVIHNGADEETIESTPALPNKKYNNIWSCAASWRPHKRLSENIRYFMEHKEEGDILIVAGNVSPEYMVKDPSVAYMGQLSQKQLYSLYKASTNFLHLAWLDHCPNVVVDARAAGCHIICSTAGGTKEIAGLNSTLIVEPDWDFEPTELYKPPSMDFSKKINNELESCYNMTNVAKKYEDAMWGLL
jgi:glycosyltransferase involved in cell wall biosynthesis